VTVRDGQAPARARRNQKLLQLRHPWSRPGSATVLRHGTPRRPPRWSDGTDRDEGSCLQPARRLSEDSVEVIRGFSESGSEPAKMAPRSPSHLSGKRVMGTPSSGETGSTRVRVVTCQHHEFVGHPRVNARATRQRYARLSWQLSDLVPLTGSVTGHGSPTCQALMWNRHRLRSQPVRHSAAVGG